MFLRRLVGRWLPWGLFAAGALHALAAWRVPAYAPRLRVTYLMWLALPATLALAALAPGLEQTSYAIPFVAALALAIAWFVRGLWTTRLGFVTSECQALPMDKRFRFRHTSVPGTSCGQPLRPRPAPRGNGSTMRR